MKNSSTEKNSGKVVVIIIMGILLLATCGFICYDKLLKKDEDVSKNCNCPTCTNEGNTVVDDGFDEEDKKLKTCTIDMKNKSEVNSNQIDQICGEDFFENFYRQVIIKNIKIKDKNFDVKYLFEGLYNDPDDRFIKVYVNDTLFELHKAIYSNAISNINIEDGLLELAEYSFTDVPALNKLYDIYGESTRKDVIGEDF